MALKCPLKEGRGSTLYNLLDKTASIIYSVGKERVRVTENKANQIDTKE